MRGGMGMLGLQNAPPVVLSVFNFNDGPMLAKAQEADDFKLLPSEADAVVDTLVNESARTARALEAAMVAIAGGIAIDVRTVLAGKFLD